ncbi:cytochrome P450 315a1, mitochondrial-like [Macrobrachium nipponense]|uniref:cytochrome P450 315a1, mitochondrial-like n=1 Tax=Macrobrachium nipponense TaxID=159736 RepID=UPI0030C87039
MSTAVTSLFRRQLRRAGSYLKVLQQRRQRATLAAPFEDFQPTLSPGVVNGLASPKTYKEMPSSPGMPILGTLPEFVAAGGVQNQHNYIAKRHQQLGSVFKERLAGHELVYVSDPSVVRDVFANEGQYPKHYIPEAWLLYNEDRQANRGLFFMEGEEWKTNRSILNRRLLRPDSIKPHFDNFGEVSDSLVQHWATSYAGGVVTNLEKELYRWGIESLGVMVFGNRLGFLNNKRSPSAAYSEDNMEMEKFISAIHGIFKETSAMGMFPPGLARALKLPMWTRFAEAVDRALDIGQEMVMKGLHDSKTRLEKGGSPSSLLDQLLITEKLEEENIVRLLTDLFLAAADTTSHTAIWSLYLLGRHPEVVSRLRQEIHKATGSSGVVKGEHLSSMPYLKGVVKESLRLYPVAPFLTRALDRDTVLGEYLVPGGTMVILSVYSTGRDPSYFPSPDTFAPQRWIRESAGGVRPLTRHAVSSSSPPASSASCPFSAKRGSSSNASSGKLHSYAFIPFGIGARSCIGRRISETQLHLMLAKLVQNFDIHAQNEVDMVMRMVGVTSQPLQLEISPISKCR